MLEREGQPDSIFDLAYEAQNASVRNRLGGKINYGPDPAAGADRHRPGDRLPGLRHPDDVEAILARRADVLRGTTEEDVLSLERFIHLGYEFGPAPRADRPPEAGALPRLNGKYANIREATKDYPHLHMVREMADGYPHCLHAYRFLLHNVETGSCPPASCSTRSCSPRSGGRTPWPTWSPSACTSCSPSIRIPRCSFRGSTAEADNLPSAPPPPAGTGRAPRLPRRG